MGGELVSRRGVEPQPDKLSGDRLATCRQGGSSGGQTVATITDCLIGRVHDASIVRRGAIGQSWFGGGCWLCWGGVRCTTIVSEVDEEATTLIDRP